MQQTWLEAFFRAWYVVRNQTKDLSNHSTSNLAAPCRQTWIQPSPVCLKSCEESCLSMHSYFVFKFGSITICRKNLAESCPFNFTFISTGYTLLMGVLAGSPSNSSVFVILPLLVSHQSRSSGLLKIICCNLLFMAFWFGIVLFFSDGHQTETLCLLYAWQMFFPWTTPQLSVWLLIKQRILFSVLWDHNCSFWSTSGSTYSLMS